MALTSDEIRAQLKRAQAWADEAQADVHRLLAKMMKRRGPFKKKKSGRPSIWWGMEGYVLVRAVEEIQANERCSRSVAIKKAINKEHILKKCAAIRRLSDRTLQIRYQQAADHWSKTRAASLKRELDAANDIAKQARAAVRAIRGVLDAIEGPGVPDEDFL